MDLVFFVFLFILGRLIGACVMDYRYRQGSVMLLVLGPYIGIGPDGGFSGQIHEGNHQMMSIGIPTQLEYMQL